MKRPIKKIFILRIEESHCYKCNHTAINVISAIGNSHEINDDEVEHIKPTQVRKGFINDGGG